MRVLGIDTSSKFLSIAVYELPFSFSRGESFPRKRESRCDNYIDSCFRRNDKSKVAEESHLLDRKHSDLLVPKIKEMLEKKNLSIDDVDAFVVGLGPGSFTGLRIGVSAVKGFGIATGKPCIGVPSIDAIAMNVDGEEKRKVVPIIDAKRGNVYSAIYVRKAYQVIRLSGYRLLKIDELMAKLKNDAIFLGDGISIYRETIKHLNKKAAFLGEEYWYPAAGNLIKLALGKIKRKTDLNKLKPIYLYKKDCQVREQVKFV